MRMNNKNKPCLVAQKMWEKKKKQKPIFETENPLNIRKPTAENAPKNGAFIYLPTFSHHTND